MRAYEFRAEARRALKNRWVIAIAVTLVAAILGGTIYTNLNGVFSTAGAKRSVDSVNITADEEELSSAVTFFNDKVQGALEKLDADRDSRLTRLTSYIVLAASAAALAVLTASLLRLLIGGGVSFGYARFMLALADGKEAGFSTLFSRMQYLLKGFIMNLLISVYVALWSLFLVIPGIVKAYSYAMTPYILAENPKMGVNEAITASRRMMRGNKWRLFCLRLSFIGWHILVGLTAGVGNVILNPYIEASQAVFYREVSRS